MGRVPSPRVVAAVTIAVLIGACSSSDQEATSTTALAASTTSLVAELPTTTAPMTSPAESTTSSSLSPELPPPPPARTPEQEYWPMHGIDSRWRGSNSIDLDDVDGDGLVDLVTNYEFDQRFNVSFHPGADAATAPWPTIDLVLPTEPGRGADTESASLADLDGDGNLDIVGSQGGHESSWFDGYDPGVRVVWGPPAEQAREADAWMDAGKFPATDGGGHFLWQDPADVDGDGDLDVLFGGSKLFDQDHPTGMWWMEAPDNRSERRDLSAWVLRPIDPETTGGHGFVRFDVDGDGDQDLIDAACDFVSEGTETAVRWYEHPGADGLDQPWTEHVLYRSSDFYPKPQITLGNFDRDADTEFLTTTNELLVLFDPTAPGTFDVVEIPKPEIVAWHSRMLVTGDIDGDGDDDVAGALTHEGGQVPGEVASVYWLEQQPGTALDEWPVHVIKWSSGRTMDLPSFGEKWDQGRLSDVDDDGDLDLVANQEEWFVDDDGEITAFDNPALDPEAVSLVWFENQLAEPPAMCDLTSGSCTIEAELPTVMADGSWISRNHYPGASGAYLQSFAGRSIESCPPEDGPAGCVAATDGVVAADRPGGVGYLIEGAPAGEYDLWARILVPAKFGVHFGGERSGTAWVTVNDQPMVLTGDASESGAWIWTLVTDALRVDGNHQLDLRLRQRGLAIDKFVVQPAGSPPPD